MTMDKDKDKLREDKYTQLAQRTTQGRPEELEPEQELPRSEQDLPKQKFSEKRQTIRIQRQHHTCLPENYGRFVF